jgi:hypothetical protein
MTDTPTKTPTPAQKPEPRPCFYYTRSHGCCHGANDRKPECPGICPLYKPEGEVNLDEVLAELGYCESRR